MTSSESVLTAARASAVRPRACFRGFPCSRPNRFSVAFTSGRDAGSGSPARWWTAETAAKRLRAVASALARASTRCSK